MIEQLPLEGTSIHNGGKRCWGCDQTVNYTLGFCERCWGELPEEIKSAYNLANFTGEPWRAPIHEAIIRGLVAKRRPPPGPRPPRPTPSPKGKGPMPSLADLGL